MFRKTLEPEPAEQHDLSELHKAGYSKCVAVIGLLSLVCLVFQETVSDVVGFWSYYDYTHGFLIPVVVLVLVWGCRWEIAALEVKPSWSGFGLLCVALWFWLLSRLVHIQLIEHLSVLGMMHAVVLSTLGTRIYGVVFFPLGYLTLAIPLGEGIKPWLMELTATFSSLALRVFDIPTFREGQYFVLPGGTFVVADACSGFNYIFAGFSISVLIAYFYFRSWPKRIAFVLISCFLFVTANGARASLIMAIGSATEMRHLARDHEWFGWMLFVIVLFGLAWVSRRWSDDSVEEHA